MVTVCGSSLDGDGEGHASQCMHGALLIGTLLNKSCWDDC